VIPAALPAAALLLSFLTPASVPVEEAFQAGSPEGLYALLASGSVLISLPDPIAFSDQVTREQALLLFRRVFAGFRTIEFRSEGPASAPAGRPGGILKARWLVHDIGTGAREEFRFFFYLVREPPARGRGTGLSATMWRILEIRAERLGPA
jgi:hypothetical protein